MVTALGTHSSCQHAGMRVGWGVPVAALAWLATTGTVHAAERCAVPGARVVREDAAARVLDIHGRFFGCLRGHVPRLLARDIVEANFDYTNTNSRFRLHGGTLEGVKG